MIEFINNYFNHADEKGSIVGLVNFGQWEELNIIESLKNSVRGGHYHEITTELFIILEGRIEITLESLNQNKTKKVEVIKGDVFLIKPKIIHTFIVLENSSWINCLSKKIDPNNIDIHRK
jgi:dTDP-4-dehydrorhamnose 3,5-epimerase-like enzyme